MERLDYQQKLDRIIADLQQTGRVPSLLLHCCCAPCSSYVLEYLSQWFSITVYYYNPNISPLAEYEKRLAELKRFIAEFPFRHPVRMEPCPYNPEAFFSVAKGFEKCPEGGERCFRCFALRLEQAARIAAEKHFDYYTTTLTISPLKNAVKLNEIGESQAIKYGISWLPSDFKKREGYKRSIVLSKQYGLYRQNYCGCVFSKAERNSAEPTQSKPADNGNSIE